MADEALYHLLWWLLARDAGDEAFHCLRKGSKLLDGEFVEIEDVIPGGMVILRQKLFTLRMRVKEFEDYSGMRFWVTE